MAPRVRVVGSINLDLVITVERLPRPGETVLGGELFRAAGGKGANQAVAAARLGASVEMVGAVGDDAAGGELVAGLGAEGVRARVDVAPDHATGTAVIAVDAAGENTIIVSPGANAALDPAWVVAASEPVDAVMLQLEVPVATSLVAARDARAAGTMVVLNAAPATRASGLPDLLTRTDVLVVNEEEASELASIFDLGAASAADLAAGLWATGPAAVVVTRGGAGSLAVDAAGLHEAPAWPITAIDTVGAGDAFCAGLAVALADGAPISRALEWANACGALAATVRGARPSLPMRASVEALIASR